MSGNVFGSSTTKKPRKSSSILHLAAPWSSRVGFAFEWRLRRHLHHIAISGVRPATFHYKETQNQDRIPVINGDRNDDKFAHGVCRQTEPVLKEVFSLCEPEC